MKITKTALCYMDEHIGKDINVKLFKKDENGAKEYLGTLKEFNQNEIIIETEEQETKIERKNISQIKTVYNW